MRALFAAATALVLSATAPAATAQGRLDSAPKSIALPTRAQDYVQNAALNDRFLIEISRLGVARARSDELRGVANMTIDQHTASSNTLLGAITQAGLADPITSSPGKGRTAMLDALQQPSSGSKEFDDRYLSALIQTHKETVALHRNYAEKGDNEILRAYAANAATVEAGHLDQLNKIRP